MEPRHPHLGGPEGRERQAQVKGARFAAVGSLIVVAAVALVIVLSATGGSGLRSSTGAATPSSADGTSTTNSGGVTAPILAYQAINQPPPQTALPPTLYVPAEQFSAQMQALKTAGWHAVTLDQLEANWTRGASLGSGKPIVVSFDNGYASQYTNALPVLKGLGWVGVENLQVNGLSPAEGGLSDAQVRGLIGSGWELDAEGVNQTNLTVIDPVQLSSEVATARQTLRSRYSAPVNWFSYPSGRYDPTVVVAVRAAGYRGATTSAPGWASPQADRFRLPGFRSLAAPARHSCSHRSGPPARPSHRQRPLPASEPHFTYPAQAGGFARPGRTVRLRVRGRHHFKAVTVDEHPRRRLPRSAQPQALQDPC